MHNDLQQILASAKLHLQVSCPDLSSRPGLKKVEDMLKESIEKSRSLSSELSPVIVYHSSLSQALKWLVSRMKEQFGLEVQLGADKEHAIEDESLRVFLFRAVQELLFNTVKHSGVNSTRVVLSAADRQFTIRVSDSGRGFNPETINDPNANNGIGLLSMRERSKAMGGSLLIESSPGRGCCSTLSVPFTVSKGKPSEKTETTALDSNGLKSPGARLQWHRRHE